MTSSDLDSIARRRFLTVAAAGAGAVLAPVAALAEGHDLLDNYAEQDARLDGKTAFWLTRGREYVVQGGTVRPVCDRYAIGAQRVIRQPAGGLKRPYVETAFALMPGATEAASELTSPVTGKAYPNPITRPLRLTLWISPAGEITQDVKLPHLGIESHYQGALSFVNNPMGPPLLSYAMTVQATLPTGKLALTEMGPYQPDVARRGNGFTPATRDIIVMEEAPTYLVGAGGTGTMMGVLPSLKFASVGELANALTPVERTYYAGWFKSWERLLNASEDVVI